MNQLLDWETFESVQMEVGTVIFASPFPEAKQPAMIVHVDFGDTRGVLKTSAQITKRYQPQDIVGKQVVGVVNFSPKQIGPMRSEFLLLGALEAEKGTAILTVDKFVQPGSRIA